MTDVIATHFYHFHDLPKNGVFEPKGESQYNGRRFQVLDGTLFFTWEHRITNIIIILGLVYLTRGMILKFEWIWDCWHEGVLGEKKIIAYVDMSSIPPLQNGVEVSRLPAPSQGLLEYQQPRSSPIIEEIVEDDKLKEKANNTVPSSAVRAPVTPVVRASKPSFQSPTITALSSVFSKDSPVRQAAGAILGSALKPKNIANSVQTPGPSKGNKEKENIVTQKAKGVPQQSVSTPSQPDYWTKRGAHTPNAR